MTVSILFVCLGNICRSPLAHGIFRQLVAVEGLDVRVESAGTGDWHIGYPPDKRASAEAARHGIDISDLRAEQVTPAHVKRFDYIVAMDAQNLIDLKAMAPVGARARLSMLLDHAEGEGAAGKDVPDPYYGGAEGFAETFRLVESGARGLLAEVRRAHFA